MRPTGSRLLAVFAAFALVALVACGGGATPSPASSAAANPPSAAGSTAAGGSAPAGGAAACAVAPAGSTATVTVSIKNFTFTPAAVQAKVGDIVAWKNGDSAPHSATMDAGTCDTDSIINGASAMLVFTAPGTYTYHCKIHPAQMKNVTVEVK